MNETIEFDKATTAVNHIKELIDLYWDNTIKEDQYLSEMTIFFRYSKNRGFILRGNELAPIMERLGKKRLSTFKEHLPKIDNGKYTVL